MSLLQCNIPLETSSELFEGCSTLDHIPGKTIKESLGLIEYITKGVAGDIHRSCAGIFGGLLEVALSAGANAVVNARHVSGSYQNPGTGKNVNYVIAYGDAVIVEEHE